MVDKLCWLERPDSIREGRRLDPDTLHYKEKLTSVWFFLFYRINFQMAGASRKHSGRSSVRPRYSPQSRSGLSRNGFLFSQVRECSILIPGTAWQKLHQMTFLNWKVLSFVEKTTILKFDTFQGVEFDTQLSFTVSMILFGLINEYTNSVFHRILDLKRDWIFILVPFFCPAFSKTKNALDDPKHLWYKQFQLLISPDIIFSFQP
jgi:hypothetical protein